MKNVAESFTIAQTLTLGGYKNAIAPEDVGQILGIKCSEEIYMFSNISNGELFETNQEKNIKFRVFTKKKF